jgi:sugar lactone lactonase YvrE
VNFNVAVAGTGPFTYHWQLNGANLSNNIITTVAGNGLTGYSGAVLPATNTSLNNPYAVALDAVGNFYIADTDNESIRKVTPNGILTTVAGNGATGYFGDSGPATNASLNYPFGVALDAVGNLYIADLGNGRIRKVGANGIITTVAGNGDQGYSGDGGPATNASLFSPGGVAFDGVGNLYIADVDNQRVRKVDTNGNITTVAGTGALGYYGDGGPATNADLDYPSGLALDAAGNLYIGDPGNERIRKVGTNGIITTVAGTGASGYYGDGGPVTNADLDYPSGLALDAVGYLYIADVYNQRTRRVDTNGITTTVAGTGTGAPGYYGDGGPPTSASLNYPFGVALDAAGNLYIADTYNQRIRKVLLYAGYPTLTLRDVGASDAGNYTVVITSPYGSVTSAMAALTVTIPATPPQIVSSGASFGFLSNQFGFNVSGSVGQTVVVDGSTNLLNWTALFTNTLGGNPVYFFDPAWTNFPRRFYRARLP